MIMGWEGLEPKQMRVSVHHSLFAHNLGRNPMIVPVGPARPDACLLDFRSNVIYNWGGAQGAGELAAVNHGGAPLDRAAGTVVKVNLINNVYIPGPDTGGGFTLNGGIACVSGPVRVFLAGNFGPKCEAGCTDTHWDRALVDVSDVSKIKFASKEVYGSDAEFVAPPITTTPTNEVFETVLRGVGPTKPKRDAVDDRIVREVRTRTGKIGPFDGVEKVPLSLYPVLKSSAPPADTDNDGMPDAWETAHALDPSNPADGPAVAKNGYTNLENYINELAGDRVP
jgi:hypothetical protein